MTEKKSILTFEWDQKNETLEIHGNFDGLKELEVHIHNLLASNKAEHVHLMSESWGGEELSSEKQCLENELINHVKIFIWPD